MSRVWAALRKNLGLVAIVLAYGIARVLLERLPTGSGLLTPEGKVIAGDAAIALAALGLRLLVLFVVAPLAAWRAVRGLWEGRGARVGS